MSSIVVNCSAYKCIRNSNGVCARAFVNLKVECSCVVCKDYEEYLEDPKLEEPNQCDTCSHQTNPTDYPACPNILFVNGVCVNREVKK